MPSCDMGSIPLSRVHLSESIADKPEAQWLLYLLGMSAGTVPAGAEGTEPLNDEQKAGFLMFVTGSISVPASGWSYCATNHPCIW
jgi:hypothetical protein